MLVQRSLLFIAVPVVGALFLGLLACGPATPSQEEQGQRPTLAAPAGHSVPGRAEATLGGGFSGSGTGGNGNTGTYGNGNSNLHPNSHA